MNRFAAAVTVLLAAALPACEQDTKAKFGPPSATYTVRGVVESLPDAIAGSELEVRHEAIPNFVDETGAVTGMPSMIMPFPLAKGLSLDGIAKGDKIELTFAVWWKPRNHYEATKIVELPADTALTFPAARPAPNDPAATPPTDPAAPPTNPPAAPPSGG